MSLDSVTYWEAVADHRLGRYLTHLEHANLGKALRTFAQPGIALEIGCGGGRWSRILAAQGWRLICTDVDSHSVEVCRQRLPDARCVAVGPEERELPCAARSVDLVVCYEVEPVTESSWFPREAARVLRPGGKLVTNFLNSLSARSALHKILRHSASHNGFYRNSYISKRSRLCDAGFTVLTQTGCCWLPFARASNSPLVPLCAALERAALLRHLPVLSPWILVIAQRH